MRRYLMLGIVVLCLSGVARAEEGYEDLFNGTDLSGWEGNPELWSVEDGAITGKTRGGKQLRYNQFLVWTGGTVADFELKVEFKLEGDNNSGVQYRSRRLPDIGEWSVGGYQADIHSNPPYTGMLYDERGRGIVAQRGQKVTINKDGQKGVASLEVPVEPIDVTRWHELTIIANGPRLTHKIDGVTTVEVVDEQEGQRDAEGILAFQVHVGPAMKVQFKNVRLKRLNPPADKKVSAAVAEPKAAKKQEDRPRPQWVWLKEGNAPAKRVYLRKDFKIRGNVATARLFIAADDRLKVFINGQEVAEHDTFKTPLYVDVTRNLAGGDEERSYTVAIEGQNGGGPGAALLQLEVDSGFRQTQTIVTDSSWLASTKSAPGWERKDFKAEGWQPAEVVGKLGEGPWNLTEEKILQAAKLRQPEATPIDRLIFKKGFQVELIYSVPMAAEGSWVSMCVDPRGRFIVSDQYGGLFRVTPPGINGAEQVRIEKINVDIGEAQGLLWAFDSLYVVVNRGKQYESGVYRVKDADGDDQLDTLETLRLLPGSGGEHGPHAALLSPDGKSIYIVCGNKTDLTEFASTRVPRLWDEDMLLPRIYGKGFMKGVPAPGGYISRMDPDGKNWELLTAGFRNQYDAAFNADGELFTYDADMEWDINTPWYRPTRVCHVLSGVDYGWRNGSAKYPEYYADTLPPVVNIGPGSPTGVCFGYGARFPSRYQQALFICDWSYGKLYAVHLEPQGASYTAQFEEFITGTPLPLTDIVVNPVDGAMYFTIGGRKVQSGMYKVTYTGPDSTEPVDARQQAGADQRAQLHRLQALHSGDHPDAVATAWPFLKSDDRVLRSAARTAIEHRPTAEWALQALREQHPQARLEALLALCRAQQREGKDPKTAIDTPPPVWGAGHPGADGMRQIVQAGVLASLQELDWQALSHQQRLAALRTLELALLRFGQPGPEVREQLLTRLSDLAPGSGPEMNTLLLDLLVYLQSPRAAALGMTLLDNAPSQEEQMNYAKALSYLRTGWTPELQESYFRWFVKASGYKGGVGFELFVKDIRNEALSALSEDQYARLEPILELKPEGQVNPFAAAPRPFVKEWKMDELLALMQDGMKGRDYDHGRKMFGAANCFACHRFAGEGGALGPDLTGLAGRFDARAILESVLEPSKVVSDQYAAVQIQTITGKIVVGRIVNLSGDSYRVNTNMLDPNAIEGVDRKEIEEMVPSKTSMMPQGLLNTLSQDEALDLMAFLLSRGDRNSPMFKPAPQAQVSQ